MMDLSQTQNGFFCFFNIVKLPRGWMYMITWIVSFFCLVLIYFYYYILLLDEFLIPMPFQIHNMVVTIYMSESYIILKSFVNFGHVD